MDFKNKKVTVIGLGLHGGGVATVKWLKKQDAKVLVTDLKKRKELIPSLKKLKGLKVQYVLGKHRVADFKKTDLVVASPGVPRDSKYLKIARKNGIPVENDASLFFQSYPWLVTAAIGVTGTKGKSTTVALLYEIFKKAGKKVILAGHNLTPVLGHQIPKGTKNLVLFEFSSWRLAGLKKHKISPPISVITNITPDHLNRYRSMRDYINDKKIIFKYQKPSDFIILNRNNSVTEKLGKEVISQRYWFSKKYFREENGTYVKKTKKQKNKKTVIIFRRNGREQNIGRVEDWQFRGEHNLENALAAVTVAKITGISNKVIIQVFKNFRGISDRLELIKTVRGVKYYNDTTATTPQAAIAALKSFRNKKIILIAGGADKKLKFKEFASAIKKHCQAVILLPGTATKKIKNQLGIADYPENPRKLGHGAGKLRVVRTMKEAVKKASELAKGDDIVLLSPGCASFGMFEHEFDRGEQFKKAVKSL